MEQKIIVSADCDGTLTNLEKSAEGFTANYLRRVQKDLNLSPEQFQRVWNTCQTEVKENPNDHGFRDPETGVITAPSNGDHMTFVRSIAEYLLTTLLQNPESLGFEKNHKWPKPLPQDGVQLNTFIDTKFFLPTYDETKGEKLDFKEGIEDFLDWLLGVTEKRSIITNSSTTKIEDEVDKIGFGGRVPVHGDAKKYILNTKWALPGRGLPTMDVKPILERLYYLQREFYFKALMASGFNLEGKKIIIGDCLEMDLILPVILGADGIYMTRPTSPPHEIEIAKMLEFQIVSNLQETRAAIENIISL